MEKRVLSNPSHGGGGNKANSVGSFDIIDFIDNHQFMESVKGNLSYDFTVESKCNANDLLEIIKDILTSSIALVRRDNHAPKSKVPMDASKTIIPSNISHLINWICCQMTCEATRGKNLEESLGMIFQKLSSYQWTTQVLLVLAAFALHYGAFWYISEAPSDGENAHAACLLKGLSSLKKKLRSDENNAIITLNNVVNDLWKLTNSLVGLNKRLDQYRGKQVTELAKAFQTIPLWSYETIIAILATGNCFARLIDVDDEFAESELEKLTSSVSHTKSAVLQAVHACNRQIARMEEYQKYVKRVEAPMDIVDFLKSLLAGKDSSQDPIITGHNNKPVKFESFRKKKVWLIISDLEISDDDIAILKKIPQDPVHYELVWIPIVDARPNISEALKNFESLVPWAFKVDPRKMNGLARLYIKEEWCYQRETMVVVLDSHGRVEDRDAMPRLRIAGSPHFHPRLDSFNWVQFVIKESIVPHETLDATKYILFYGGTAATKLEPNVANEIPHLSVVRIEDTKCFLTRLRSCLIFRLGALQVQSAETNPLRDGIVRDMSEAYTACQIGGFAILTRGTDLQVQHISLFHATSALESDLKRVRGQVTKGVDLAKAFKERGTGVQEPSDCKHFCIPYYPGLGDLCCPDCSQFVKYDLSFTCCHSGSGKGGAQPATSSANATTK